MYLLVILVSNHHICRSDGHRQTSRPIAGIPLCLCAVSGHLNVVNVRSIVAEVETSLAGTGHHVVWQIKRENLIGLSGFCDVALYLSMFDVQLRTM